MTGSADSSHRPVLVVPLRGFAQAKSRLSSILSPEERNILARTCAARVMSRSATCDVVVVTDDHDVQRWAIDAGAHIEHVEATTLNAALSEAMPSILDRFPYGDVVIAHGDIVDPSGLDALVSTTHAPESPVILVPDRHGRGTNVMRLSRAIASVWIFEYGTNSFELHMRRARSLGYTPLVWHDEGLSLDLDTPEDLADVRVRTIMASLLPHLSTLEQETP